MSKSLYISKSGLKPKLLDYLRNVEHHRQSIVVTDRGRPVAKIIPFDQDEKDMLQELRGSVISYVDPLEPVGEEDWDLKL